MSHKQLLAVLIGVICTCATAEISPNAPKRVDRAASSEDHRLWSNGAIFYTFSGSLLAVQHRSFLIAIRNVMDQWEEQTCLRFFYRTVQPDYIEFTMSNMSKQVRDVYYFCSTWCFEHAVISVHTLLKDTDSSLHTTWS